MTSVASVFGYFLRGDAKNRPNASFNSFLTYGGMCSIFFTFSSDICFQDIAEYGAWVSVGPTEGCIRQYSVYDDARSAPHKITGP